MDTCLPDWNTEVGIELPLPVQRKPLGLENELMVWQNGEVVLNSQTNRKQSKQDYETISWIDESFEKEFYDSLFPEIQSSNPVEPNKAFIKFGASEVNHIVSLPLPPPSFDQNSESVVKAKCSVRTVSSSHCASNQVVNDIDMNWVSFSCGIDGKTVSAGVEEQYGRNVSPRYESTEKETFRQAITSCSGGSGSSFWNQSNETNSLKRKSRDVEESECRSDATELDSAGGNKSSQKAGTTRRNRLAEVHNLSERRRRDRINERMKALQELIPHSNKSDKASMLDEAIEYLKSLQWQLQLMWMGSGMVPMMLPGMHHYMSCFGTGLGVGPPMLPAIQNLMRLSRLQLVGQAVNIAATSANQAPVPHPSQMQNSSFPEQCVNYMGFRSIPNASQSINMFNIGFHSAQQNPALTPPDNGNGSIG